jgi:hypothetical protein
MAALESAIYEWLMRQITSQLPERLLYRSRIPPKADRQLRDDILLMCGSFSEHSVKSFMKILRFAQNDYYYSMFPSAYYLRTQISAVKKVRQGAARQRRRRGNLRPQSSQKLKLRNAMQHATAL